MDLGLTLPQDRIDELVRSGVWINRTILDYLDDVLARDPERPAITDYNGETGQSTSLSYGEIDPNWPEEDEYLRDEKSVKLNALLKKEKQKIRYIYDFGDDWQHVIELEKILSTDTASSTPKCITGRRACPPEDCGGIDGYYEILDIINDPDHPEREETLEWLGEEDFDPAFFDVNEINSRLSDL